ncbi:MAG: pyocin knob domain-containing protein [Niallia sp.]
MLYTPKLLLKLPENHEHVLVEDFNENFTKIDTEIAKIIDEETGAEAKFKQHADNKDNPHGVTKDQIGLGDVQNFGVATQGEAEAGISTSKYMTPERTKQAIDKILTPEERSKWNAAEQIVTQNKESWSWNGNKVLDTRTHKATVSYYRSLSLSTRTHYEFKSYSDVEIPASYVKNNVGYVVVETFVPWSDYSGGGITQIAQLSSGLTIKRISINPNGTEIWGNWFPTIYAQERVTNLNFNDYVAPGVYQVGGTPINGPTNTSGDWGVLIVEVSGDVIIQTSKGLSNNIWTRYKTNAGNWSPWEQILTTSHYNQLFQSVSNGKAAIANAITQKGIWTAANAEFATMANNISVISTGKKFASGITNLSVDKTTFNYNNGSVGGSHFYVNVSGLNFRPSLILFNYTYSSKHVAVYNNTTGEESVFLSLQTSSYNGNATNFHLHGNSGFAYVNATSFRLPVVIGQNLGTTSNGGPVTWTAFE